METTTETVFTCDGCGNDVTRSRHMQDWRILVTDQSMGHKPGPVTAMAVSPPLGRDYHFCNIACLHKWSDLEKAETQRRDDERQRRLIAEQSKPSNAGAFVFKGGGVTFGGDE